MRTVQGLLMLSLLILSWLFIIAVILGLLREYVV